MEKQSTRKLFMLVIAVVSLFLLCMSAFMLTSCGEEHVHSYDEGKVTTAATCGQNGVKTYSCSCGDKYTEVIPATGSHTYESKETVAASCAQSGVKTNTCKVCGDTYTETIPAVGHKYTAAVTKAATCSVVGVKTYTCSVCKDTYTEEIPTVPHNYEEKATASSGYAYNEKKELVWLTSENYDAEEIDHDHIYTKEGVQLSCTATCFNQYVCKDCGAVSETTVTTKTAHAHTPSSTSKPATCDKEGYNEGGYCVLCKATLTDTTIAALGHTWTRKPADAGEDWKPVAGEDYTLSTADADNKAANCVAEGFVTWVCKDCGAKEQHTLPALGHGWERTETPVKDTDYTIGVGYTQAKVPTCTEKGIEVWVCKYCTGLFAGGVKDHELEATGHAYKYYTYEENLGENDGENYKEKTGSEELAEGQEFNCLYVQVCSNCYDINRGSHLSDGVAATCRTSTMCEICDEILVPAVDHKLVNVNEITSVWDAKANNNAGAYKEGTTDAQKELYEAYTAVSAVEATSWLAAEVATHKKVGNAVYVCTACLLAADGGETVTWNKANKELKTSKEYNASIVVGTTVPHDYVTYTLSLDACADTEHGANWWENYVIADANCAKGFVLIDVCTTEACETAPSVYINAKATADHVATDANGLYGKVERSAHVLEVLPGYQKDVHYVEANCHTAPVVVYICSNKGCTTKIAVSLDDYVASKEGKDHIYTYKADLDESVFESTDYADGKIVYYTGNDPARHDGEMISCGYHCNLCKGDLDHTVYTFQYLMSKYSQYYNDYKFFIYTDPVESLRLTDVDTTIAACQGYEIGGANQVPIKLLTAGHVFLYKEGKVYQATKIEVFYDNDTELPVAGNTFVGEDGLTYLKVSDSDLFYVKVVEADFVRQITDETIIDAIKAVDPDAIPEVPANALVAGAATLEITNAFDGVDKVYTNETEAAVTVTISAASANLSLMQVTADGSEVVTPVNGVYTFTVAAGETLTLNFSTADWNPGTVTYTVAIA